MIISCVIVFLALSSTSEALNQWLTITTEEIQKIGACFARASDKSIRDEVHECSRKVSEPFFTTYIECVKDILELDDDVDDMDVSQMAWNYGADDPSIFGEANECMSERTICPKSREQLETFIKERKIAEKCFRGLYNKVCGGCNATEDNFGAKSSPVPKDDENSKIDDDFEKSDDLPSEKSIDKLPSSLESEEKIDLGDTDVSDGNSGNDDDLLPSDFSHFEGPIYGLKNLRNMAGSSNGEGVLSNVGGLPGLGYGSPGLGYGSPSFGYGLSSLGYGSPDLGYDSRSSGYGSPSSKNMESENALKNAGIVTGGLRDVGDLGKEGRLPGLENFNVGNLALNRGSKRGRNGYNF